MEIPLIRILHLTWPQGEAIVMLGRQHNISRPSILESLGHLVRVPLLRLLVEDGSEVVVTEVGAKVLPMIGRCGRIRDTHDVVIPLGVTIVLDLAKLSTVM